MKHIKSYKLFESISDIENTVRDICTELEDDLFEITINTNEHDESLQILINKNSKFFNLEDIQDSLLRVIDYMESEGYKNKIQYKLPHKSISIKISHQDYPRYVDLTGREYRIEGVFKHIDIIFWKNNPKNDHIKSYKPLVSQNESIGISDFYNIGFFTLSTLFFSYGMKYLRKDFDRRRFKKMMIEEETSKYSKSMCRIEEDDNTISVYKTKNPILNNNDEIVFSLDKKTRIIEWFNDSLYDKSVKIKLSKSDFNKMIEDLNYAKNIIESIKDCFYDLNDEGYTANLKSVDFRNSSFRVEIKKSNGNDFKLKDMESHLRDFVEKIETIHNAKIDDKLKPINPTYGNYLKSVYPEVSISLPLKMTIFDFDEEAESEADLDIDNLIIPFIKK